MRLIDILRTKMYGRKKRLKPGMERSVIMSDQLTKKSSAKRPFYKRSKDLVKESMRRDGLRRRREAMLRSMYNWNKPSRLVNLSSNEFD